MIPRLRGFPPPSFRVCVYRSVRVESSSLSLFCRRDPGVSFFWPKRVGDALPRCGIPAWFRDPPIPHPRQKRNKIGFPEGMKGDK